MEALWGTLVRGLPLLKRPRRFIRFDSVSFSWLHAAGKVRRAFFDIHQFVSELQRSKLGDIRLSTNEARNVPRREFSMCNCPGAILSGLAQFSSFHEMGETRSMAKIWPATARREGR